MTKKNILLSLTGVLLLLLVGIYIWRYNFYKNHFLPNTVINQQEVSDLTLGEANSLLINVSNQDAFIINDNQKEWKKIAVKDLGIAYNYQDELKKALTNQSPAFWPLAFTKSSKHSVKSQNIDEKVLTNYLNTLSQDVANLNKSRTRTKNASIQKQDTGFAIAKEVQGTNINEKEFIAAVKKDIENGTKSIELENYVAKPTVVSTDKKLSEDLEKIQGISKQTINYVVNGENVAVPAETISSWIDYNSENSKITLNQEQVKNYLTELANNYNTSSQPTAFTSTKRGEVSVPAGSYSWSIAVDTETKNLTNELLEGKSINRSPAFQGSASPGEKLVGTTYIEVDLVNQHMYYYKDGAVALETPIVSGKPSSVTPTGVFYVWNKERNATLRGTNDDGSTYASPVSYWMPINWTGIGLHDANWQPTFGGDRWKTYGSHGCVNTPPATMAKLFDMVSVGTPVLVF